MLNLRMSTDIVGGTENTIQLFYILFFLILMNVEIIEVEALKCFMHSIMIEALPHDIKSFHDGHDV